MSSNVGSLRVGNAIRRSFPLIGLFIDLPRFRFAMFQAAYNREDTPGRRSQFRPKPMDVRSRPRRNLAPSNAQKR